MGDNLVNTTLINPVYAVLHGRHNITMEGYPWEAHHHDRAWYVEPLLWIGLALFLSSGFYMTHKAKKRIDKDPDLALVPLKSRLQITGMGSKMKAFQLFSRPINETNAMDVHIVGYAALVLFAATRDLRFCCIFFLWYVAKTLMVSILSIKSFLGSRLRSEFATKIANKASKRMTVHQASRHDEWTVRRWEVDDCGKRVMKPKEHTPACAWTFQKKTITKTVTGKDQRKDVPVASITDKDQWEVETIKASNIYIDFNRTLASASIVFAVQTMLVLVYVFACIKSLTNDQGSEKRWFCWLRTLPVQILMQNMMGSDFFGHLSAWMAIFQAKALQRAHALEWIDDGEKDTVDDPDVFGWVEKSDIEMWARAFMDFFVNSLYMEILFLVFPLSLTGQSGLDFVYGAFGVAFMVKLDDASDSSFKVGRQKQEEEDEEDEEEEEERKEEERVSLVA